MATAGKINNSETTGEEGDGDFDDDNESDEDDEEVSDTDDDEDDFEEDDKLDAKDDTEIKKKLGKLGSMLNTIKNNSSSDDDENDEKEEESDESDSVDASDHEEVNQGSDDYSDENESENEEVESNHSAESTTKGVRSAEEDEPDNKKKPKILSEEEERAKYRETLSKLTVEQILAIKDSLGTKAFNDKWSGNKKNKEKKIIPTFKRENKNRPREISSKMRVPKLVKTVQVAKVEKRDPRFDPLCGEFDKNSFRKNYKFLKGVKEKELDVLKKKLKTCEVEEKPNIKYLIQRAENQLRSEKQLEDRQVETTRQAQERRERLSAGGGGGSGPIFKSAREQREEKLVDTYEQLKSKGQLDQAIRKKNKRNLAKDRKRLGKAYDE